MTAIIQPITGILLIAIVTARHAETAAVLNVAKLTEAIPAKVAEAVPPVTSEAIQAPKALIPLHSPTVAKRTVATVARIIFPTKPIDTICPVLSSVFKKRS